MASSSAIHKAMAAIQAGLADGIAKARKNQQQNFTFRSIDDVYDTLHPLLVAHGVFVTPSVTDHKSDEYTTSRGTVMLRSVVSVDFEFIAAEDGSSVIARMTGEASDAGDKSTSKAVSMAYKYAFFQVFCIPTGEDSDQNSNDGPARAGRSRTMGGAPKITDGQARKVYADCQARAQELEGDDAMVRQIGAALLDAFNIPKLTELPKPDMDKALAFVREWQPPRAGDHQEGTPNDDSSTSEAPTD